MRCTLFLPENSRLPSETRLLFFIPAILCWPRATFLTSYVIPPRLRTTFPLFFPLRGPRISSCPPPFPRLTIRLLPPSHRQLPLKTFIDSPPALGSFSVDSCHSKSVSGNNVSF